MFTTIRKNQRVLMLIVVILTILAFTFFYVHTGSIGSGEVGRGVSVYNRVMTQGEIDRLAGNYQLAVVLGLYDLLESLGGTVRNEVVALNNVVFNQLIIAHEANVLGVIPRDDQIARAIVECPIFQTEGRFDSTKYRNFVKEEMIPRGMNERQLEELVCDSLRIARIREIVTGSVMVSDQEIRNAFRGYQKQDLQVVKFDFLKYLAKVEVAEDQVRQLYVKDLAKLKSVETRTVHYVVFEVPQEKSALQGKERVEALQTVANQAASFSESLSNKKRSIQDAAKEFGFAVHISLPFDRTGSGSGAEGFHGDLPSLAPSIFKLTQEHPYSDALEGPTRTRFYVLELVAVNSPRPLTLEEARPQLLESLRSQAATKLLFEEGQAALASISELLRKGQPFENACAEVGGQTEEILGAVLYASSSPEHALYSKIALLLSPGQMSTLQPSPDGAFAVFLKKREATDPLELAQKTALLKARLLKKKQTLLFLEWLQTARKKADIRSYQPRS